MASLSNPFTEFADRIAADIDAALTDAVPRGGGCPDRLSEAMAYALLAPGKRLRPMLVLMAADVCGLPANQAMAPACAVEMIHAYSLVHDDLPAMDDDDMRRGRPSCHIQFGEATAILVGDALQSLAFEVLASGMPAEKAARSCAELARASGATALAGGQSDDLASEGTAGSLPMLEAIHQRKTGALIRVSLRLGAIAAAASEEDIQRLDRFGLCVGTVFQITDDLLDFQGSESDLGKRTGKDAERGKLTYPGFLGVEASRQQAEALTAQACKEVEPFGDSSATLQALARFVLERKR